MLFALPADALPVRLLLLVHIAAGTTALLAGLVPMLGRKGGSAHVLAGRLYTACMVLVALTAVGLCLLQPLRFSRLFLAGVAVLSFYLSFTGWRAARRRSLHLPLPDRLLAVAALLTGLLMVGAGLVLGALLLGFFGLLLCVFAGLDTWRLLRPQSTQGAWLLRHLTRMGGSYISAVTAFVVVNLGHVLPAGAPGWLGLVGWLAPTFLGGYLIGRAVRRYRRPAAGAAQARFTLLALLALGSLHTTAQPVPPRLQGFIADTAGQPLPYATVGVVGKGVGTVADAQGHFQLELPAGTVRPTDTLRFALLGYVARQYPVGGLVATPLQVALAQAVHDLPEVRVRARGLDSARIGNGRYHTNLQTNFALGTQPGLNVGSEIGRIFQLPRGGAWLERFRFVLSANTFDTVRLRINVYRLHGGVPDEPLLTQPLYHTLTRPGSARVDVDLRPCQLFATDDVAVTVEWIGHSRRGNALALPLLMPAFGTHLYRYGAANRWKRFPSMSTTMELFVKH
ncbi:hypothetical protein GCM10027048_04590 [Hymenobacter coalescens]